MQRGVVDSSSEVGSRRRAPGMLVPLHKNPRDNITQMHRLNMKVREQSRGSGWTNFAGNERRRRRMWRLRRSIGAAWGRDGRGRGGEMEEGGQGFKKEEDSGSLMALTPGLKRAANARKSHERERSQRERRVMTGGDTMSVGEENGSLVGRG